MEERRIVAYRSSEELTEGAIVNLGIGMPEGIARIAAERGLLDHCTLTVESGPIGGAPAGGLSFGASAYPQAVIDQPAQFDFYDGGGLDFAALGAAQIDELGNVNVSQFGRRFVGVGGFVNIAHSARRLVFCCTMTANGLEIAVEQGQLRILREGMAVKFVSRVDQISFSTECPSAKGQRVLYITERAVFELTPEGLELVEAAPGIEVERQVFGVMAFRPRARRVRLMPASCFAVAESP